MHGKAGGRKASTCGTQQRAAPPIRRLVDHSLNSANMQLCMTLHHHSNGPQFYLSFISHSTRISTSYKPASSSQLPAPSFDGHDSAMRARVWRKRNPTATDAGTVHHLRGPYCYMYTANRPAASGRYQPQLWRLREASCTHRFLSRYLISCRHFRPHYRFWGLVACGKAEPVQTMLSISGRYSKATFAARHDQSSEKTFG